MIMRRKTTEEFIEEAIKIHGDKYDYSKVNYINNHTKVLLYDNILKNYFEMTPACLLDGQENPKLRYQKIREKLSSSTEEFIKRAQKIHGDKYDYSGVEYVNNRTKVCIICPDHGEFWQATEKHLIGRGCPKCAHRKKPTTEEFIEKAKKVHGNKYTYEKTKYGKNNKTKIIVTCPKHGDFLINPTSFLKGSGCKYCTKGEIFTQNDFLKKAKQVHGDKYDYSKVEYVNATTKVCIVCPKHGDFNQKPIKHLRGNGCPECAKEINVSETKLYNMIVSYFNNDEVTHSYRDKKILGRQEIDIFFSKYKIGIEYQGLQHFEPVNFYGYSKKDVKTIFLENAKRDEEKLKKCISNGIQLLYYSDTKHTEFLGQKVYHNYEDLCKTIEQLITDQVIKNEKNK